MYLKLSSGVVAVIIFPLVMKQAFQWKPDFSGHESYLFCWSLVYSQVRGSHHVISLSKLLQRFCKSSPRYLVFLLQGSMRNHVLTVATVLSALELCSAMVTRRLALCRLWLEEPHQQPPSRDWEGALWKMTFDYQMHSKPGLPSITPSALSRAAGVLNAYVFIV